MARERAKSLGVAFETFARQWGIQLTAKLRVASEVSFLAVDLRSYEQYGASLPATTAMALFTVEGLPGKGVVQLPISAALSWCGRMMGATSPVAAQERPLTAIERALIRRLIEDALEDLRYCLGALCTAELEFDEIQHSAHSAQAGSATDLMVVASFLLPEGAGLSRDEGLAAGGRSHEVGGASTATIALPAGALLAGAAPSDAGDRVPASDRILEQLNRVPVDVTVEFSESPVTPGLVLGLAIGDLIPLRHPRHRPLDVRVDGCPLARAAVGASGSRLAVVVVPAEERE